MARNLIDKNYMNQSTLFTLGLACAAAFASVAVVADTLSEDVTIVTHADDEEDGGDLPSAGPDPSGPGSSSGTNTQLKISDFSSIPYFWTFESLDDTHGWTFNSGEIKTSYSGSYIYVVAAISPELDLSGFTMPRLWIADKNNGELHNLSWYNGNRPVSVSADGEHWCTLSGFSFILPLWTKYISISNGSMSIGRFIIADICTPEEKALLIANDSEYYTRKPDDDMALYDFNGDGHLDGIGGDDWRFSPPCCESVADTYISMTTPESLLRYDYGCEEVYSTAYEGIYVLKAASGSSGKSYYLISFRMPGYIPVDQLTEARYAQVDADLDGEPEYLNPETGELYTVGADGRFLRSRLQTSPLVAEDDDKPQTTGGLVSTNRSTLSAGYVGAQMFGLDVTGGSYSSGALDGGDFISVDVDGNGFPDLVNFNSGKVHYGKGDGTYLSADFEGQMFLMDFDGDGLQDYLLYDGNSITLHLRQADGSVKSKNVISGFTCTNVWCRDVDGDGDADIVLSLESSQKFIVVLENTGSGSFKRHETKVDLDSGNTLNPYKFVDCCDIDNDSHYEVIAFYYKNDNNQNRIAYRLNGVKLDTTPIAVADMEIGENSRPSAPAQAPDIAYEPSTGLLKVTWGNGSDKETPVRDLTYAIRVGTAPGLDDVVRADASSDGVRKNAGQGNMGLLHERIFDTGSWPQGRLCIAVQTVDGNGLGSPFSADAVFEKTQPRLGFTVSSRYREMAVGDTISLATDVTLASGSSYIWDLDGARTIASNPAGSAIDIVFAEAGEKTLSLGIGNDGGERSGNFTRKITVGPTPMHGITAGTPSSTAILFDMDEDGTLESYIPYKWNYEGSGQFTKGDKDGNYTPIPKMFNSHNLVSKFSGPAIGTFDINGDGLCDVVSSGSYSSELYLGYNLGDLDMEFEATNESDHHNIYFRRWIDFDNDGKYDNLYLSDSRFLSRNLGDYKHFEIAVEGEDLPRGILIDWNRDGLVDVVAAEQYFYSQPYELVVSLNNGDFTFTESERTTLPELFSWNDVVIADFDGNGKYDFLFERYNGDPEINGTYVLWDDCEVTKLFNSFDVKGVCDYNNDGWLEIGYAVNYRNYYMVQFSPGRKFEKIKTEVNLDNAFDPVYRSSNGLLYAGSQRLGVDNERPLPPTAVRHTQNSKYVVIEWDHSADKETRPGDMRYNVSVKHKGATGEGAWVISPANSGKNGVPVPPHKPLITCNRFTIPVGNLPVGEYEVKVQGVDLMGDCSDFSDTYMMTVHESVNIELQATGEADVEVPVKVLVNGDYTLDLDGGEELKSLGGIHTVVWHTTGQKTVTVNGQSAVIDIRPAPECGFSVPASACSGDRIVFEAENADNGFWYTVESKYDFATGSYVTTQIPLEANNRYAEFRVIDSGTCEVIPKGNGDIDIRHDVYSDFSTRTGSGKIAVAPASAPAIDLVTADPETGKYRLQWTNPDEVRQGAEAIIVYKEGSVTDRYEQLAELPLSATEYVDLTSNPDVMSARYVLAYKLSYGESRHSTPHQPIHVMICRGAGSGWNLIWGHYEGTVIQQYRILRGESPESLAVIATVSGSIASYSDLTAPAGTALYYAVECVMDADAGYRTLRTASRRASAPRSNVVAAAGGNIVAVRSIKIVADGGTNIVADTEPASLQLRAMVDPVGATFRRVNWIVLEGDDVVTVDQTGRVHPLGNGTAVVRAMSIDGSGVYDDITVTVSGYSGIASPVVDGGSLTAVCFGDELVISGLPADESADVYVFSLGGYTVLSVEGHCGAELRSQGFRREKGVYIVKAVTASGRTLGCKFINR